jgi:hypothetical protein
MFKFRTTMLQSDGNAYIYFKALLTTVGDKMTFTVLNTKQFKIIFTLRQKPSNNNIKINNLKPI